MKNKIIILHDTFLYKWWWERLIMMMAKALEADIASGFFSEGSFNLRKSSAINLAAKSKIPTPIVVSINWASDISL